MIYPTADRPVEHVRIATLPGMWERTVTLGSAGKTFSVTGWKIGWAIAPPSLAQAVLMAHQWIPFAVATPLQEAIAVALEEAAEQDYFTWLRTMYQAKRDRLLDALAAAGLEPDPALQVDAITTEQAGQQAMAQLLATGVALDAVFAASDLIALGAMKALRAHGLKVPEQVAVAGFDDIAMASFAQPGLSTVQQDTKLAGEVLVDSLIRLIQGETVESRTLPVKLVPRGSTHAG